MSSLATVHPLEQDRARSEGLRPSAEVLSAVAHELRQPLSNIETIAYYLSMVLPPGDAKQAQLARIRELVEQSNWILSSGVSLTSSAGEHMHRIPMALDELISESIAVSGLALANVILALGEGLPLVHLDPRDGRELVDSVLMLFRTLADGSGPIKVTTSQSSGGGVLLEIRAPGDFSNGVRGAGSELAVASVRRLAESHGGTFQLEAAIDSGSAIGGIRGRLMLP